MCLYRCWMGQTRIYIHTTSECKADNLYFELINNTYDTVPYGDLPRYV